MLLPTKKRRAKTANKTAKTVVNESNINKAAEKRTMYDTILKDTINLLLKNKVFPFKKYQDVQKMKPLSYQIILLSNKKHDTFK